MVTLELHIGHKHSTIEFGNADLQKIIMGMRYIMVLPDSDLELTITKLEQGLPLHPSQPTIAGSSSKKRSQSLDSVTARHIIKKLCGPNCLYAPCCKQCVWHLHGMECPLTPSHDTTFPSKGNTLVHKPEFETTFSTIKEAIDSLPAEEADVPMADAAMLSEDDEDKHLMVPELIKNTLSICDHAHLWHECLHAPSTKCPVNSELPCQWEEVCIDRQWINGSTLPPPASACVEHQHMKKITTTMWCHKENGFY